MSGNTMDSLYRAMASLGLYSLHSGSLIDRELAAYSTGFSALEQALGATQEDIFVQTAGGDALERHETLVGLTPRRALDDGARREIVLYRLGAAPFDFDREGMINSIRATGMEAALQEDYENESLTVQYIRGVDQTLTLDNLKDSVRTVLPAHLAVEFDMGNLTWDLFDGADVLWDDWDGTGMTWDEFDLNGHFLFDREQSLSEN